MVVSAKDGTAAAYMAGEGGEKEVKKYEKVFASTHASHQSIARLMGVCSDWWSVYRLT